MQNWKLIALIMGGTLLAVMGIGFLFSGDKSKAADINLLLGDQRHITTGQAVSDKSNEASEAAKSEAKVTLVEFSDFQCPACKASQPLVKQLVSENSGKVKLVYRNYPLTTLHKNALKAARVAEAVGETDKYWEFHDMLFDKQDEWAESDKAEEFFKKYAKSLDIDESLVDKGITDDKYYQLVKKDMNDGDKLGINSTPTFYVNGVEVKTPLLSNSVSNALK
jgi:protein-disulfide isomerase